MLLTLSVLKEKEEKSHREDPDLRQEKYLCFQEQERQRSQAGDEKQEGGSKSGAQPPDQSSLHASCFALRGTYTRAQPRGNCAVCMTSPADGEQVHVCISEQHNPAPV